MSAVLRLAYQQSLTHLKLSEWRALLIALMMAIIIASLMAVLGERIERTLLRQGSEILGADLVLSHTRPLSRDYLEQAASFNLQTSQVTQLATMANQSENFLLVTIRALQGAYPRGEILLDQAADTALPTAGTAWAEAGVFERLGINVGDQITLGNKTFTLTRVIRSAPDRGRGFISFNPQLIIQHDELADTGLLGPGARMRYRQLFAGDGDAIAQWQQYLSEQLPEGAQLQSLETQTGQQNSALNKASSYLRLGSLFAILISALTIFLSLRRFTQSQSKRAAILKTLGLSDRQLLNLYLLQLGLAWVAVAAVATVMAILLERLGLHLLTDLLPQPIPAATVSTYLVGPLLGLAIIFSMGLPPLLSLKNCHPAQLLQDQAQHKTLLNYWPYVTAALLLLGFTSLYLNNFVLTLSLSAVLIISAYLIGWLGERLCHRIAQVLARRHPLGALLLSRTRQQKRWYRIQIPVICLLFALLSINFVALNDLVSRWQNELPPDTPNHFLINIQSWEKEALQQTLQQYQVDSQLWPIYRGRLVKINDLALSEALTPKQRQEPSLKRELNLTSATGLPEHNQLVAGQWQQQNSISVEAEEARELGLSLGDKLTFNVGGEEVSAEITSIRSVKWDSFQPNFFFIFSPDVLAPLTASYLTSFYVDESQTQLSRDIVQNFPTITLIDVRQILEQLQQLLSKLSLLSGALMLLTTAAGVVLLYVTLTQELEQRRFENALLQTLGASEQQCRKLDQLEMLVMGAVSGGLAVLITELSLWPIHQQLLQLPAELHPFLWLLLPAISMLVFSLAGVFCHRRQSVSQSYRRLLAKR